MSPKHNQEKHIRNAHELITMYENKLRESDDQQQQAAFRRNIEEQQRLIAGYLEQYNQICTKTRQPMEQDIVEIAASLGFPLDPVATSPPNQPAAPTSNTATQVGRDQINAQGSHGFINQPTGPVSQHFGDKISSSPVIRGDHNVVTNTGNISNISGQVAVGSDIAQADNHSRASVHTSSSMQPSEPRQRTNDTRLAQIVQTALQHDSLEDLLFTLGNYTTFEVDIEALGSDPAVQSRNLVKLCRDNKQRTALVQSLIDRDEKLQLIGSAHEQTWLQWARELDNR